MDIIELFNIFKTILFYSIFQLQTYIGYRYVQKKVGRKGVTNLWPMHKHRNTIQVPVLIQKTVHMKTINNCTTTMYRYSTSSGTVHVKQVVMWIRIRCNADPDSGFALAYIRIRIEGVDNRHERKKNSTQSFHGKNYVGFQRFSTH